MSLLSFYVSFSLLLFVVPLTLSQSSPSPNQLLQTTCTLTSNYQFCLQTLESDPRTSNAGDIKALSTIALRIAMTNTNNMSTYISGLAKNATQATLKSVMKTCNDKYNYAGEALKSAQDSLAQENYDYAYVNVGAAQEYLDSCTRLVHKNALVIEKLMVAREDELKHLLTTILDIVSQLNSD